MIVDALMVSVGSTNFDNRSFQLNDEANLNIYDADFAARQIEIFQDDLRRDVVALGDRKRGAPDAIYGTPLLLAQAREKPAAGL